MDRPLRVTLPDSRVTTNSYDALGRLTNRTGAGAVPVSCGYDALGRMTNLVDGEGNAVGFSFDVMGRLTRKTHADLFCWSYS